MQKFEISKEDLKNLFGFIDRVELRGAEVPAFVKILNIFNSPTQEKKKIKKK